LLAFSTLALALFWHDVQTGRRGWLAAVGAATGLAVLAKGPVGLVLPAGVAILFLAWQRKLRHLWGLRTVWFVLLLVLVAVPWYALVTAETKGAWLAGFLKNHNVNRATSALEGHSGPPYYYLPVLLVGLAPWSVFLGLAFWHGWRRLRQGDELERSAMRFLAVWFVLYLVFFTVVRTKLPNYVLPVYPALALLTGHLLERWRSGALVLPDWLPRSALTFLGLVGVVVTGALLIAGGVVDLPELRGRVFPEATAWAWLGAIPLAGAVLGWWFQARGRRGGVIAAVAGSAVLLSAVLTCWGLEALEPRKAPRQLAQALPSDHLRREARLAAYDWFLPSVVFYSRREIIRLSGPDYVRQFLAQPLPAYLFVSEPTWKHLCRKSPLPGRVLARQRDLESGRIILLVANEAGRRRE
jgi:4-amino-4-deoxy-L-arabinose transferase-like glycosyltransferase